ncbi:DUF2783 domain-containing protein [Blastomonas sp. AAP53]|uniref:DUF2783 domain-containing protein n=1 Tax=Blastomonas sp. AAP53 TaxID=1248760 RepID=UPI0002EB8CAC|nr:DUF2783 domain-containing protein [Blastomonas sp. AAP53]
MSALVTTPNIAAPDDIYALVLAAHAGRSEAESVKINAKLVLLLANHIGDPKVIQEALAIAINAK